MEEDVRVLGLPVLQDLFGFGVRVFGEPGFVAEKVFNCRERWSDRVDSASSKSGRVHAPRQSSNHRLPESCVLTSAAVYLPRKSGNENEVISQATANG